MATKELNSRFIFKRDTAANWGTNNPILMSGEVGFETDTRKFKIGNGTTAWSNLGYPLNPVAVTQITGAGNAITSNVAQTGPSDNDSDLVTAAQVKSWCEESFAPMIFTQNFYMVVDNTQSQPIKYATNSTDEPTVNSNNYMSTSTVNTSFDWDGTSKLIITGATSNVNATVASIGGITVSMNMSFSRNTTLEFGGRTLISKDGGNTWLRLSTNQAFGSKSYNGNSNFTEISYVEYNIVWDNPDHLYEIEAGDILRTELFKRQIDAQAVETRIYCGCNVDGTPYYSIMTMNSTSISINTNQITDESITEVKLSAEVQAKLNSGGGGTPAASNVTYDNSTSGLMATNVQLVLDELSSDLDNYVLQTRTINGKSLNSNILLTASDVGALSSSVSKLPNPNALTINGTSYDGSLAKSVNTGTVTSVAVSGSNGITVSGSPITSNGIITVSLSMTSAQYTKLIALLNAISSINNNVVTFSNTVKASDFDTTT